MKKIISLSALLLLASTLASRAETALLVGEEGASIPSSAKAPVLVSPGEKVHLFAGFFDLEEGVPPQALGDPEGIFEWHLQCEKGPPCPEEALETTERGRVFQVPFDARAGFSVLVTHVSPSGSLDGQGEVKLRISRETRISPPNGTAMPAASPSPLRYHSRRASGNDSASGKPSQSNRGGVATMRGDAPAEGASGPRGSRGKGTPSATEGTDGSSYFGSSYEFPPAGAGPSTSARGYNRENSVPVLSCANVPGIDGAMHVICEDQSKELRVQATPRPGKKKVKSGKKKPSPPKGSPRKKASL